MSKQRRRKDMYHPLPHLTITRLNEQAHEALKLMIDVAFGELLAKDLPEWIKQKGRGIVLFNFKGPTIGTIQPPVYVSASEWNTMPNLISEAVKVEIDNALVEYNPATHYICLVFGAESDYRGNFGWWKSRIHALPQLRIDRG